MWGCTSPHIPFFGKPYQPHLHPTLEKIRQLESHHFFEQMYHDRFGEEYAEIKRVRAWLKAHPLRTTLLAYLLDDDPYKA